MEYKLFDEYIVLQALLKELSLISSGGASKQFLEENIVLFNGEREQRRRKKIRIGDQISIPSMDILINVVAPNEEEKAEYAEQVAEKRRVAALVKKMNQENKKHKTNKSVALSSDKTSSRKKKTVRFPGR